MDINKEIIRIAQKYELPEQLLSAIISVESSNNHFAIRSEPNYKYLWDCGHNRPFRKLSSKEVLSSLPPSDFRSSIGSKATEWAGQKMSWGPMQVMGAVAREYGFLGYFPQLCGPLGIEYGAKHLSALYKRYSIRAGIAGVVSAYNAGSPRTTDNGFVNQAYVDKVMKAWGR